MDIFTALVEAGKVENPHFTIFSLNWYLCWYICLKYTYHSAFQNSFPLYNNSRPSKWLKCHYKDRNDLLWYHGTLGTMSSEYKAASSWPYRNEMYHLCYKLVILWHKSHKGRKIHCSFLNLIWPFRKMNRVLTEFSMHLKNQHTYAKGRTLIFHRTVFSEILPTLEKKVILLNLS